ncbi:MAG TPA: metalloregulator ArsR/SmtB family transcription factor [Actinomycetota bacterium]|nr:metalloregulator ArsR/SmtB family transcription factor [Actinomycetota bacterium]
MTNEVQRLKADLFRALAHPLRVQVLELLTEGERPVADLIARTGAEASQLSQQLGVLRRAGVLVSRREASSVYYRLRDPRTLHLLATANEVLATSLTQSRELLADLQAGDPIRAAKPRPRVRAE